MAFPFSSVLAVRRSTGSLHSEHSGNRDGGSVVVSDLHLSRRFEYRSVCSTSRTKSNSVSHWLEQMCLGGVLDVGLVLQVMITRRGGRDFPTACGVEPIGQHTASKSFIGASWTVIENKSGLNSLGFSMIRPMPCKREAQRTQNAANAKRDRSALANCATNYAE